MIASKGTNCLKHQVVPADLAYGDHGAGEVIPPGATLLFDIVVVNVEKVKSSLNLTISHGKELCF